MMMMMMIIMMGGKKDGGDGCNRDDDEVFKEFSMCKHWYPLLFDAIVFLVSSM